MTPPGSRVLATSKRFSDEPAFVLHRYDWSESSLILEVFTRNHGRIALVAKGAKRPTSSFRPILLPLQPLHLAFGGDAEIRSLKSAEWQGGHVMPTGHALLSGYYLNELLLTLLARDDPHPHLFDIYARVVQVLASEHGEVLPAAPACRHSVAARVTLGMPRWRVLRTSATLFRLTERAVKTLFIRPECPSSFAGCAGS